MVEQARYDTRRHVRAKGAAACVVRSKLQPVRKIGERAGIERFCHLGCMQKKADVEEKGERHRAVSFKVAFIM